MKLIILISLLVFSLNSQMVSAKTVYVKSVVVKLLESPKHESKVIANLKRGDSLTEINTEKKWTNVEVGGKSGWIPSILLSDKELMPKQSLLLNDVDISKKARKRASTFTSTAAARGLKSDSDDVFKNLGGGDYAALERMEKSYVPLNVSIPFLRDGQKEVRK